MPSGPGVIEDALIAEIVRTVPRGIATFLLTSRQDADAIAEQHATIGSSTVQLVDAVSEQELVRLRAKLPAVQVVQVIHVRDESSVEEACALSALVDALLLDSGNPSLTVKELGGTGRTHDWQLSRRIREAVSVPLYLAGGLRAENVADAIRAVRPYGLDLCSGVRRDGALDAVKLASFMHAVRSAAQSAP
jgi:phosphoribosylanthranilate isomerase